MYSIYDILISTSESLTIIEMSQNKNILHIYWRMSLFSCWIEELHKIYYDIYNITNEDVEITDKKTNYDKLDSYLPECIKSIILDNITNICKSLKSSILHNNFDRYMHVIKPLLDILDKYYCDVAILIRDVENIRKSTIENTYRNTSTSVNTNNNDRKVKYENNYYDMKYKKMRSNSYDFDDNDNSIALNSSNSNSVIAVGASIASSWWKNNNDKTISSHICASKGNNDERICNQSSCNILTAITGTLESTCTSSQNTQNGDVKGAVCPLGCIPNIPRGPNLYMIQEVIE
jgi:hypothetical protein